MKNNLEPALYDVWRLSFEYEDQPGNTKERPVVIGAIDEETAAVLAVKVTSHLPRPDFPGEVALQDWKEAGLSKPSVARCSKTIVVPKAAFDGFLRYGKLSPRDAEQIEENLRMLGKTI